MKRFNIRAYGIYIKDKSVMVTDEFRMGTRITKFPGGGLEFGEGLAECIQRECIEEFGQEFRVLDHFYTTDFFQVSAFSDDHQLISVYYLIDPVDDLTCSLADSPFAYPEEVDGAQCFRFIPLQKLSENDFTFPIDKHVAKMIREKYA